MQQASKNSAGDDFSNADGGHHQRDWERYAVCIPQYKGDNEHVCYNWGDDSNAGAFCPEHPGACSANQCGDRAKNQIRQRCAANSVGNEASSCKAGNCRRGKHGKYGEGLGDSHLYFLEGKWGENNGQHHVQCGDDSPLGDVEDFFLCNLIKPP